MVTTSTQWNANANSRTNPTQAPAQSGATLGASTTLTAAIGPDDVIFSIQYTNDVSWPTNLKLSLDAANWEEWSFQVSLLADRQGLTDYLNGTSSRPDKATYPKAHQIWGINDRSFKSFLFSHISRNDYRNVASCPTSHAVFEELRKVHEKQRPHAKMVLIQKAINIRYRPDVAFSTTIEEIDGLYTRIIDMGPFDNDQLRATLHMNALDNYEHVQSHLMNLSEDPSFSSKTIICHLNEEENLMRRRAEQTTPTSSIALAAQGRNFSNARPQSTCINCKKVGHLANFCIQPGGKMAGRSIEDARTAQRASSNKATTSKPTGTTTANVATTDAQVTPVGTASTPKSTPEVIVIGGVAYYPAALPPTSTACVAIAQQAQTARIETLRTYADSAANSLYSYHSYFALSGPVKASVDWDLYSLPIDDTVVDVSPITGASHIIPAGAADCPFILDSGASNHISPELSDFQSLRPISPHSIQGFNDSSTNAIGIGDIDLCIASGHKLSLKDVLYVPSCSKRLISVHALTRNGYNFVTFGPNDCWVADKNNEIIVHGSLSASTSLYVLNCSSTRVTHSKPNSAGTSSTLYAKRVPDVETWHRRLGHCNTRTIIDMARNKVAKGMLIDLSSSPPSCDACILGKQMRLSVPKVQEGVRASLPLERVHIDLCGPMPAVSTSGRLYSMDVVDDHTGYVWSLPLKLKSDAANILRGWHRAVENQSGHKLKTIVTHNGELVSNSMADWCSLNGIDHQHTAPYTSAHNGRAERLHRTILGRARSMRLACNAPASLWDEFCATAAYLTNLTASSSLAGKTPYELWFGQIPSLGHLREIGCRAFALIQTNNPKIYRCSTPRTLIGYLPHSKVYRLWDNTTGAIFNSFHVRFIEHLDSQPSDLLPGTTLLFDQDAPPSWDAPGE